MLTHHVVVEEMENLRVRVRSDLNARLTEFSDRRRISKQDIVEATLQWMLDQDELTQAMILQQIPPSTDLLAVALNRLVGAAKDADFLVRRHAETLGVDPSTLIIAPAPDAGAATPDGPPRAARPGPTAVLDAAGGVTGVRRDAPPPAVPTTPPPPKGRRPKEASR